MLKSVPVEEQCRRYKHFNVHKKALGWEYMINAVNHYSLAKTLETLKD
jgi:hypothetical protein